MTPNQSLQKSNLLREYLRTDYLQGICNVFPHEVIDKYDSSGTRDRIYNSENTILTMINSAIQEDKTLQNAVNIFGRIHQNHSVRIMNDAESSIEMEKQEDLKNIEVRRGPKKKYKLKVPKSKVSEISVNTAAYSKARKRVSFELLHEIFKKTSENKDSACWWHGMKTYITDGTYVQMQDSEELRKLYNVRHTAEEKNTDNYPQGLVQTIIEQGSGLIHDYALSNRHTSELSLIYQLIPDIPKGSLLLADDLYNCYAIFALARKYGFDLIVPGKRVKNYTVIEVIANNDEIVEVKKNEHPKWLPKGESLPDKLLLRRISFLSPDGVGIMVLYTTLLDKYIPGCEIIIKYFTRWDIEITILEIKEIMDINVLRGKTDDIIRKELVSAFIAYNLIRKVIMQSTKETAFSPKANIIQEFFKNNKDILIDRKGRVYNRWSPGRYAKTANQNS
ncbi:MAG: IS4 family transposase [Bacteroidota bacterium]